MLTERGLSMEELWRRAAVAGTGERRQNARLRNVFDTAFLMIESFLDPGAGWPTHSLSHLSFRVLRENFADLSPGDLQTLVVALHRSYIERNPHRNDHLIRPDEMQSPTHRVSA